MGTRALSRQQHRLVEVVREGLATLEVAGGQSLLVAVSGGSDSMAMLELLSLVEPDIGFTMTVAYVDHRVREDTRGDVRLVSKAAQRVGAGFELLRLPDTGARDEATLRTMRYRVLQELCSRQGHTRICTGHTEDDQIETVLFRFLRGAGRLGLGGIPASRGNIIRPVIDLKRSELKYFLNSRDIQWSDDPTNESPQYSRNRLRNEVIPAIRESFGDGCLEHLPAFARIWSQESDYLEDQAERYRRFAVRAGRLDLVALDDLPPALRNRVIRGWLEEEGLQGPSELAHLSALEAIAKSREGTQEISLPGITVVREYATMRVRADDARPAQLQEYRLALRLDQDSRLKAPDGSWTIELLASQAGPCSEAASPYSQEVDLATDALQKPLVVRPVYKGESMPGSATSTGAKIHEVMTDLRIPRRIRKGWPVLEAGPQVVWVPGLGVRAEALAGPDAAAKVRIRWRLSQA